MTVKYFAVPFATGGDVAAIPDPEQSNGSVSYTQGFGPYYQLDLVTNPDALPIPRNQFNQLMLDITGAIQLYQKNCYPFFITTTLNDGNPYYYSMFNPIYYSNGKVYESLVNSNNTEPTVTSGWQNSWRLNDFSCQKTTLDGVTFAVGVMNTNVVYWNSGANNFSLAVADSTAAQNAIGLADTTNNRVITYGDITGLSGLVAGSFYYLSSTTPGLITTTPSSVQLGVAKSATELLLNISINGPASGNIPVGAMLDYLSGPVPAGFLLADGSAVSRTTYANLFKVLSYSLSGVTTTGQPQVTGLSSTQYLFPGMAVTGTGVPTGTTILTVDSGTQVTLSSNISTGGTPTLIFYVFGAGDESTTFNLPLFARHTSIGSGGTGTAYVGNVTGQMGGEEAHVQTSGELATHTHSASVQVLTNIAGSPPNYAAGAGNSPVVSAVSVSNAGSSQAANVMQPSIVVTKIIKY